MSRRPGTPSRSPRCRRPRRRRARSEPARPCAAERARPRNANPAASSAAAPPARTGSSSATAESGRHRAQPRHHAYLLEREQRPRDAEARSRETDDARTRITALLDEPGRASHPRSPGHATASTAPILRRLGDPIGDLADGEAFAGAALDHERREDERHRPVRLRPQLDDDDRNAARVRGANELLVLRASGRRRRCERAPRRRCERCRRHRRRSRPARRRRASSFASCSASMPLTPIGPTRAGSSSALSVVPTAASLADERANAGRASQRASIARAHPGRGCSGARRSARGWRPWTTRRP